MARRDQQKKGRYPGDPGRFSGLRRFFRLITRRWFLELAAVVFVIVVAAVFWGQITSALGAFATSTARLFGWGLIIIAAAIAAVAWMIWRKRPLPFFNRLNRWLGLASLLLFTWGVLGWVPATGVLGGVSLGGRFGQGIVSHTDWEGIFRLFGLMVIGVLLIAPRATADAVGGAVYWVIDQFRHPKTLPHQHQESFQLHLGEPEPEPEADKPVKRKEPAPPIPFPQDTVPVKQERRKAARQAGESSTPQTLKQVAQEVWKKYGESSAAVMVDGWKLPPIDILDITPEIQFSQADNAERARLIEEALASYGVEASVVQINAGPTVTQFGLEPGWDRRYREVRERDKDGNTVISQKEISKTRVKVDRISSLSNDLALALAAPSIRIEAPVPGKSIVGIEVPNTIASMVSLRGVIETSTFQKLHGKTNLALALGKGAGGEAVAGDLAKMPHLLIAGATGSGKTVCLNTIVSCLILNNTPSEVRFIMIDPKRVELVTFNSIPHLAVPVIVEAEKAVQALRGLSREMNERYQTLATGGARNIETFNKNKQGDERMPYLVLIIDELADLMVLGGDEVEQILCRLAQLSRAVGIHLVVATQRPSVDVVTGLIKANFPTRISFAVTSQVDSRTILDFGGAEKLLGSGDMLYMPTEASKPKRLQGCYLSDAEIERLVYFWGSQQRETPTPRLKIEEVINTPVSASNAGYPEDSLLEAARELAREHDAISTSFLQRRLHIGYPRAARIMEQLQAELNDGAEEEDTYEEEEEYEGDEERDSN